MSTLREPMPDNKPDIIYYCVNTLIEASNKLQTLSTQERPINETYLRLIASKKGIEA
jgi:hypothetical protein